MLHLEICSEITFSNISTLSGIFLLLELEWSAIRMAGLTSTML